VVVLAQTLSNLVQNQPSPNQPILLGDNLILNPNNPQILMTHILEHQEGGVEMAGGEGVVVEMKAEEVGEEEEEVGNQEPPQTEEEGEEEGINFNNSSRRVNRFHQLLLHTKIINLHLNYTTMADQIKEEDKIEEEEEKEVEGGEGEEVMVDEVVVENLILLNIKMVIIILFLN